MTIRLFGHYLPSSLLLLMVAEGSVVWASVCAGVLLPYLGLPEVVPTRDGSPFPVAAILTFFVLTSMDLAGLSDVRRSYRRAELFLRLTLAFGLAYLLIAVLGYFLPLLRLSRQSYLLSLMIAFPLVSLIRIVHDQVTVSTRTRRKVLLIGTGHVSELIAKLATKEMGYEIIGCLDSACPEGREKTKGVNGEANALKIVGAVDDLAWVVKSLKPDVVVAAMEERRGALPIDTIVACKIQGVEVEDWPAFHEKLTTKLLVSHVRPSWLAFSDGFRRSRLDEVVKRFLDVAVAAIGCVLSAPILAIAAVLIKLDSPGPVFFRQERVGQNGHVFALLKLRTMRVDAEASTGPVWAKPGDTRVTRFGRLLRRSRLDEAPQLFNVLLGDMTLVGPRPERLAFVVQLQEHIPFYMYRHVLKPGITGWAQICYRYGASLEDAREKLEYDLYYIKNRSVFLDLLIIVQTLQVVLFGRGAR
ncbi:MAG TPA: TIGR03013 family XrtA/PEP-CTERM system glycosyltransferase [Candidatus Acidoferrum sp.]|nr:TIGR03013 family XrtA/PEP-CTERM system glycosyltransferase [Candidatus Acidoferrum sp.]